MSEYITNKETGKIELHFDKTDYMALDESAKKEIKSNLKLKEIKGKDGKKISIFEFYKDGQRIANTNEKGELNLSEEYKESLKSRIKRIL